MRSGIRGLMRCALLLALTQVASATTWYVNGVSGSDTNNCLSASTACKTIGHAVSRAVSGDTIRVASATYKENLTIGKSLTISGAASSTTIIDGGGVGSVATISNSSAHVTLSNLTIRNGHAPNGGGLNNDGALTINNSSISANTAYVYCSASFCGNSGGGIYNGGTLTINNSVISGNKALIRCTNQCATLGGGIYNAGSTVAINSSTISGNSASPSCPPREFCHSDGGGIFSANGAMTISKSTISGNSANESGGVDNRGTLTINNSTVSGNSASFNRGNAFGGGIYSGGSTVEINSSTISGNSALGSLGSYGGGIHGAATLQNSIVANSTSGGNCYGTMTSKGYNLSSDNTCTFNSPGDLNNTDPKLGALGNYGGPTQTIPLLAGSPAIDAGNPSGCRDSNGNLLQTDQRGMPRPDKEDTFGCDMGAYERQTD